MALLSGKSWISWPENLRSVYMYPWVIEFTIYQTRIQHDRRWHHNEGWLSLRGYRCRGRGELFFVQTLHQIYKS